MDRFFESRCNFFYFLCSLFLFFVAIFVSLSAVYISWGGEKIAVDLQEILILSRVSLGLGFACAVAAVIIGTATFKTAWAKRGGMKDTLGKDKSWEDVKRSIKDIEMLVKTKQPHSKLWSTTEKEAASHQDKNAAASLAPASWRVSSGDLYDKVSNMKAKANGNGKSMPPD